MPCSKAIIISARSRSLCSSCINRVIKVRKLDWYPVYIYPLNIYLKLRSSIALPSAVSPYWFEFLFLFQFGFGFVCYGFLVIFNWFWLPFQIYIFYGVLVYFALLFFYILLSSCVSFFLYAFSSAVRDFCISLLVSITYRSLMLLDWIYVYLFYSIFLILLY